MKFPEYFLKKWVLTVTLQNIGEKYIFFNTRNAILRTISCFFDTSNNVIRFWFSDLHVIISELIHSKSALIQRWKPDISELRKSALNNADSEKTRTDQFWNSADQRWCFSCSLNQRWNTSNLRNLLALRLQLGQRAALAALVGSVAIQESCFLRSNFSQFCSYLSWN